MTRSDAKLTVRRGDLIALYGTLRASEPGFAALGLAEALVPVGRCALEGALYDLGGCPGLVLGETGAVTADLFEVADSAIMARLDAHEDYFPARPEASIYLRRRVRLTTPPREAWVYVYNRPVAVSGRIAGGDWSAHLEARRTRGPMRRRL